MTYSLRRVSDNAGDSGQMSLGIVPTYDKDTNEVIDVQCENDCRPRLGIAIRVGSIYARSYSFQDWWQTTIITEILKDTEDYVKFKTTNSVYEWKII